MTQDYSETTKRWLKKNWGSAGDVKVKGKTMNIGEDFDVKINPATDKFNNPTMVIIRHGRGTGRLRELFSGEAAYVFRGAKGNRYDVTVPIVIACIIPSAQATEEWQNYANDWVEALLGEIERIAMTDALGAAADGIYLYMLDAMDYFDWSDNPPTLVGYIRLNALVHKSA